jgi:sugar phosphate isomerase/epimerase
MFILSGFGDEISSELEKQIKILGSEGIKHIELRSVDNKNVLELSDEDIGIIKKQINQNNFSISAIGSPIGKIKITDDFEEHLKKFERALFLAKFFETRYIRIFSYYLPEGETPEKYRDEVMRRMKVKTELAAKQSLILLNENEHGLYGDIAERCKDIITTVDSPSLKILFDPANFVIEKQKPFTDCYPELENYIEYMHIKDAKFSEEMDIRIAGEGDGQIGDILTALNKKGFNGFLSLEPHLQSRLLKRLLIISNRIKK